MNINRTELSINSKYSGNSIVDIEELVKTASELGLEAISITDFNDTNSFFELTRIIKNYSNLDIIYGTKIKVIYKDMLVKIDILVRNKQGLNNLYKILTHTNKNNLDIDIYNIFNKSEGLLIGLNVLNENIYNLLNKATKEEVYDFIKVFDYIIINPSEKHDYIKKIFDITTYYHKLLVASSDVRYINKEDKKYYEILKCQEVPEYNYLMNTKEMLDAFSYLDKINRHNIVIDNPHKINLLIDKYIPLIPEIEYFNEYNTKEMLKDRIYKRANELYNNKIPKNIRKRIEEELSYINETNAYNLLINSNLVRISEEKGYITFTRGAVASSYINYLLKITKVNPLDYNLDYRDFYKDNKNSILTLAINYDKRVIKDLVDYLNKEFDKNHVVRCGVIGYISDLTIKEKIKNYEEKNNIKLDNKELEIINHKLSKIKRMNGKLPGSYLCIPKHLDYRDISPLLNLSDSTTMIDYHKIQDNLIKITILETTYNSIYNDLIKLINIPNFNLNDLQVWNYINSSNKDQNFCINEKNQPKNIQELAKTWYIVHKTKDWTPNMAQAIEYSIIYYKLSYIKYYYKDIYDKIAKNYEY